MTETISTKTEELLAQFIELKEGLSCASFPMHHREFIAASITIDKYLGRDAVESARGEEFQAMSEDQQAGIKVKNRGTYGEYGVFHHASKPEAVLGLAVLATLKAREIIAIGLDDLPAENDLASVLKDEILEAVDVEGYLRERLLNQMMVESVLATYPDGKITRDGIKQAMMLTPEA